MRLVLTILLIITGFSHVRGQVSYQVSNYDINQSGAGNQNWDIASDGTQRIFVANNHGLLILENTDMQLYELSERTIFRSVAYINNRIFTGSFQDFGYWEVNDSDQLNYTSLVYLLENPDMNNDEIWKIIEHEGNIYFHSFGSIYSYDGSRVYRIDKSGSFMFPYKAGNVVYAQKIQGGLYQLKNDSLLFVEGSEFLQNEEVKSIISLPDESVLIGTTNGIYKYDGSAFANWDAESSDNVIRNNINTAVRTSDKIIIGTILNGIYIYDLNGDLLQNINTESQLQNNTVLSLKVDPYENLWVGMDKGLSYIAFDTPFFTYHDNTNGIGSVYAAALYNNELYVGTNQGIYWYKRNSEGYFYDETLIPQSQGQVWFLKQFDGKLYSGLNDGTYIIRDKQLDKVSSVFGGYNLKSYPGSTRDVLLQSTYSDLVVYEKNNDSWMQSYTLDGFSAPARFLEFDHIGNIWLGHAVKGIYRLQPNIQFNTIDQVRRIDEEVGLPQSTNHVFKLETRIMTSFSDTLYQWDAIDERFIPYTELDEFFSEKGTVSNIVPVGNQRYWIITPSEINLIEIHFNSTRLIYRMLPEMYNFNLVEGYENIIPLNENLHLVCLDDGFSILNLDRANKSKYPQPSVHIQSLLVSDSQEEPTQIDINNNSDLELPYSKNTVRFKWNTSQIAGNQIFFQYKLSGIESEWNDWAPITEAEYLRLPSGDYTFSVRSIGPKGLLTETATLSFAIKNPWYLTTGAYALYVIVLGSLIFTIRLYISRKRWREHGEELRSKHRHMVLEREKSEKEIIKLKNEKLESEVEHKSSQLASNTMAMMRKNNLLSSIKDELEKQKKELGDKLPDRYINSITNLIEEGIEDEKEWEIFEQLYDEAHGNFFKRLKETYPQLTPSDLRLCAYLRMNLSSKEIAPLLNISVRGVEERRYRLRKRLDIPTDTNLNELIMTF